MKSLKMAPLGLTASLLVAGLLVTACSDRNEKVTQSDTSTTVVEATPTQQDPMIDPNASTSGASTGVDSGTATDTTDAMSGAAPTAPAASENKIIPKRHAKHAKKVKKTKTSSRVEHTQEVGSTSPVYNNNESVVTGSSDETASGATTGAGEISTTVDSPVRAPGRFASANTDWGVVYEINNAAAASTP